MLNCTWTPSNPRNGCSNGWCVSKQCNFPRQGAISAFWVKWWDLQNSLSPNSQVIFIISELKVTVKDKDKGKNLYHPLINTFYIKRPIQVYFLKHHFCLYLILSFCYVHYPLLWSSVSRWHCFNHVIMYNVTLSVPINMDL